jgi:hypothetical protein
MESQPEEDMMRRSGSKVLLTGLLAAGGMVGCAHHEEAMNAAEAQPATAQTTTKETTVWERQNVAAERQNVAGHEQAAGNLVLKPQGNYKVPSGSYTQPSGEYFQPKGIYGTRGKLETQGRIFSEGEYGSYTRPTGSSKQAENLVATPEGTFFRPFGSQGQMSSTMPEKQPVAGHETEGGFFIRDDKGQTWQLSNPKLVTRVEEKLSEQGCDPGRTDGVVGPKFSSAVMQCQTKKGLPATGIVDRATAQALGLDWAALHPPMHGRAAPSGQMPSGAPSGESPSGAPSGAPSGQSPSGAPSGQSPSGAPSGQ